MRIPKDVVVVMAMEVQSFLSVPPGTNRLRRIHVHLNYYVYFYLPSRQLVLDYYACSLQFDRELTLRRLLSIQREFGL